LTRDASPERLDVSPHGALCSLGVMSANGAENGFVLFLAAAMIIRGNE
jgi:hypothetical protein